MYEAKILKHSISPSGVELITFEVNSPHAVHKDIMTHRWARNFQSFRAVPPEKLLERLNAGEFFTPEVFGHRTKGMGQRNEPIEGQKAIDQDDARWIWDRHVYHSLMIAEQLLEMGIAKQQINFVLQDLCFIRGIITTTWPQLNNFFGLRLAQDEEGNPVARPEVHRIADMMLDAFNRSEPQTVGLGAWHLPLVTDEEINQDYPEYDPKDTRNWVRHWEYWRSVSVGRCARVSYLTHAGVRDPEADIALHNRLLYDGHMSPFEHQGTPIDAPDWRVSLQTKNTGSFGHGWVQYRKLIPGEANYTELRELNAK